MFLLIYCKKTIKYLSEDIGSAYCKNIVNENECNMAMENNND